MTDVSAATLGVIRGFVETWPRRWLIVITLLVGLLAAVAVGATTSPAEQTFANLANAVQTLMSVPAPLIGVLLARDLIGAPHTVRAAPTLLAAIVLAVGIAVFGSLICAATLAFTASSAAEDPWRHAGFIAVCSVLVQIVAQLVGTGLGLLLRPVVVAFLATIVLPLGLWLALGGAEVLRTAREWLTPYATVPDLLSGQMSATNWAQWFVVLLIWGVGLNAVGLARRH